MTSGPTPSTTTHLRPLQMLTGIIFGGSVMICAARVVIDASAPMPSWWAVGLVVVALFGAAYAINVVGYSVPALPHGLPRENAEGTALRLFSQTTVLRATLAEIPVVVAFFTSFAFSPHSWLTIAVALPGSAALFALHAWPSLRTAERVQEGLEADGARSHLAEALGIGRGLSR